MILRHRGIFTELCRGATAAGSEWITTDRGFARFPVLRWGHPLQQP
ncbi:type II toxin-antitoxin system VapC family toxin [Blastococcus sp. KM273128]|nr:hypothetical protein [Blastococcus sp. KM273128]MCF6745999.1 type II toxin-antitoxin system VapC family toxin [Blastococcus sp. KM273128]